MNNIKIGNTTEEKVANWFRAKGYWSYIFARGHVGSQPVDIVAIKGGKTPEVWMVDAKHVRDNDVSFRLSRIEPNQWASLQYMSDFAKMDESKFGFAIEFDRTNQIYWLPYATAKELNQKDEKSINLTKLQKIEEIINESEDSQ